jgi:ribonucleoside-diphosphate reductase alpha chain
MDSGLMNGRGDKEKLKVLLESLRTIATDTNAEIADEIGISHSAAITCQKPSGTVSQLVDSASGIHTRHSPYYIRSVRADNKDPLTAFLKDKGVPSEPDVTKPNSTTVFYFPIKSPEGALTRDSLTAIEHLEVWKLYQEHFTDHKSSITVTVKEHEWPAVGAWVFDQFDSISGVSFLPHSDHSYRQAPYQECTEEEYEAMKLRMPPKIDWTELSLYEQEDNTTGMQSLACSSGDGSCEVVDLV